MAAEPNNPDTDDRLEEIQEEIDEVRARIPKNPGMSEPDPEVDPVMGGKGEDVNPPI